MRVLDRGGGFPESQGLMQDKLWMINILTNGANIEMGFGAVILGKIGQAVGTHKHCVLLTEASAQSRTHGR